MFLKTDEFITSFVNESKEYIKEISKYIKLLKREVSDETFASLLHQLGNFKNAALFMGFDVLFSLIKGFETLISAVVHTRIDLNAKALQLFSYTCDMFVLIVKNIDEEKSDDIPVDDFLDIFNKAINGLPFSFDKIISLLQPKSIFDLPELLPADIKKKTLGIQTIEISIERLDDLIKRFENIVLQQNKLKKYLDDINVELENKNLPFLKKLKKELSDDLEHLESSMASLQKNIYEFRLISLNRILEPLQKKIEAEALEQNKIIAFHFPEVDFFLDKDILDSVSEILYQLLKNVIDHAYETKEIRLQKGKEERLQVFLGIYKHAEHITLEFSDDGCGIDYEAVRFKALDLYPDKTAIILEMTEKELSSFLFMPGFSVVQKSSQPKHHGDGLDIVRKNLEKIRAKIFLTAEKDLGTEFSLSIPTSLATLKGVFVKAGVFTFLIPVRYISEIYNCPKNDLLYLQNNTMFRLRDEVLPVYSLNALIGEVVDTKEKGTQVILIVEYLEKKIGISINELLHTVSVIIKPLPSILKKHHIFQGLVLDENHRFVPILDIPELIERLELLQTYSLIKAEAKNIRDIKKILIIDHSAITREIQKNILEAEGFIADTAEDGIEALSIVKKRKYDIIVTDIKMPRMNGYVFIENLKRIRGYEKTPILVISSLGGRSVEEKAMEMGVSGFLFKSNFERRKMLSIVKGLIDGKE
jgi:two-component system chemotaxis sensor kinase CheA